MNICKKHLRAWVGKRDHIREGDTFHITGTADCSECEAEREERRAEVIGKQDARKAFLASLRERARVPHVLDGTAMMLDGHGRLVEVPVSLSCMFVDGEREALTAEARETAKMLFGLK